MIEQERIDYAHGRIQGLRAVLGAIIEVHPDPVALLKAIERHAQAAQARSEAVLVLEAFLEGLQEEIAMLTRAAEHAAARRK